MANSFNDPSLVEEKLKELGQQYTEALRAGKKFSVLRDIREEINELLSQLPKDQADRFRGNGWHKYLDGDGHSDS